MNARNSFDRTATLGQKNPPAVRNGLAPTVEPGSVRKAVLQRKVGFELEDPDRVVSVKDTWLSKQRFPVRKEVLYEGSGFELQADDTNGADKPSLEFVTSAFMENDAGAEELRKAFNEIIEISGKISAVGNKGKLKLGNKTLYLSSENGKGQKFKLQVTQGIPLERIARFMRYVGTGEERKFKTKIRKPLRKALYGDLGKASLAGTEVPSILGSIPSLAAVAVKVLKDNDQDKDSSVFEDATRVKGFLSLVISYVQFLNIYRKGALKYRIPLHARTNFVGQFKLLPDEQQRRLRKNGAGLLISAVVKATGRDGNAPLIDSKLQNITIAKWLSQITAGEDLLTPERHEGNENRQNLLESFGSLGEEVDPTLEDSVSEGIVFEMRHITGPSGGYVTAKQASKFAEKYLQFLARFSFGDRSKPVKFGVI